MYNKSQCSSMLQGRERVKKKERKRNLRLFFQIAIHSIDNKYRSVVHLIKSTVFKKKKNDRKEC